MYQFIHIPNKLTHLCRENCKFILFKGSLIDLKLKFINLCEFLHLSNTV